MMRFNPFVPGILLLSALAGLAIAGDGKIPITTKSHEAREAYLKGRDLQERLQAIEALQFHEQAIAADADFALGHFGCATTAVSAKSFFEHLDKAVKLSRHASEGERLWILGFQAGVNGDPAAQKKMFTKLVDIYPGDERAHNILGGYYFGQQDWERAIRAYERAIEINSGFSQPYNQLGYAYRFLEKFDAARKAFRTYIDVLPGDPNPYDSYAELQMKTGNYRESIENYRRALKINSNFVASHLGIATNYNYMGEHDAARKQLGMMLEGAVNDGQRRAAYLAVATSYIFEANLDRAIDAMRKRYDLAAAIKDAPAMSNDLIAMGNILVEFGKTKEAAAKYDESLRLILESSLGNEQKALARQFHNLNLFSLTEGTNEPAKARQYAVAFRGKAESKKNAGQIRIAHEMLGRVALMEGKFETALAELNQANLQNPYNLYRIGLAHEGNGDKSAARDWYKKANNYNPVNNMNQAFVHLKTRHLMSMK